MLLLTLLQIRWSREGLKQRHQPLVSMGVWQACDPAGSRVSGICCGVTNLPHTGGIKLKQSFHGFSESDILERFVWVVLGWGVSSCPSNPCHSHGHIGTPDRSGAEIMRQVARGMSFFLYEAQGTSLESAHRVWWISLPTWQLQGDQAA